MPRGRDRGSVPDWESILSGEAVGAGYDRLRCLLLGAARLYGAGLDFYLQAEKAGVRTRTQLPVPVLSIGNLSVGGTGKTPMTQYIVRLLCAHGWNPAILSRGYRGTLHGRNRAVSDLGGTILLSPQEAGDEPYLLACSLPGVPVVVGKDRRISGRLAIADFQSDVLVLDDGFQYWQLARDLDIVLLDARRPFDNGHALPRGLLREPKRNLARAGVIVLTRSQGLTDLERAERLCEIERLAPKARVFWADHVPGEWRPLNAAAMTRRPERAIALCGIAQPRSFLDHVRDSGVEIAGQPIIYADHQHLGTSQMKTILGKIQDYSDVSLVTTEKDAVKLDADSLPVAAYALDVCIEITDATGFLGSGASSLDTIIHCCTLV